MESKEDLIKSIANLGFSKKKATKVYQLMRDASINGWSEGWKIGYEKGYEDATPSEVLPPIFEFTGMIVCMECGNKRCPKATDTNLECTHSNEPGQKGSRYE